jgi:oxygen-independent coproporphyrinogen-3 oxidase
MTGRPFPRQPTGLYFHIPFCRTKCSYCAFTSYPCPDRPPAGYPASVAKQLELLSAHPLVGELIFGSIYIGGGTPTIYGAEALADLIEQARALLSFAHDIEISVETNPNTVTPAKLVRLHRAGFNRLSIGVQSFSDSLLAFIGRSHSAAEAHRALRSAREAGFTNLNLDLIYGLPNQTPADWQATLEAALSHEPEHLSLYELMVEEGTPFAARAKRGELPLPDEKAVLEMEEITRNLLPSHGLRRYEISNYAKSGYECRHNINYWQNGDYLGLGAGAVSGLAGIRIKSVEGPALFARLLAEGVLPWAEAEGLPPTTRFRETVIMGLRMLAGLAVSELEAHFGLTLQEVYGDLLDRLTAQGLLAVEADQLRFTDRALPVANQVLSQLV